MTSTVWSTYHKARETINLLKKEFGNPNISQRESDEATQILRHLNIFKGFIEIEKELQ